MNDRLVARNRATYDNIGDGYAALNAEIPDSVRESLDRFLGHLPAGAVVADVGCGPGRDLAELRRRGLAAYGFDLTMGMLRAGHLSGVVQSDMVRLPIRTGSLDGLWCAAAFLHVPRDLSEQTLDGFSRVLRRGAILHLSVAEGSGDEFQRARLGRGDELWVVHHEEKPLARMLRAQGFTVTSVDRSESHRRWLTFGAVRDGS